VQTDRQTYTLTITDNSMYNKAGKEKVYGGNARIIQTLKNGPFFWPIH